MTALQFLVLSKCNNEAYSMAEVGGLGWRPVGGCFDVPVHVQYTCKEQSV